MKSNPSASAPRLKDEALFFEAVAVHLARPTLPSTCLPRSSVINSAKTTLPPVNSSAFLYPPVLKFMDRISYQVIFLSRVSFITKGLLGDE